VISVGVNVTRPVIVWVARPIGVQFSGAATVCAVAVVVSAEKTKHTSRILGVVIGEVLRRGDDFGLGLVALITIRQ
jgi:hypothetical protein